MSWQIILKSLEDYSFYLKQIEKAEKMLEKLYHNAAKNKNISLNSDYKTAISAMEEAIKQFRKQLEVYNTSNPKERFQ